MGIRSRGGEVEEGGEWRKKGGFTRPYGAFIEVLLAL
jgi:hypothetical protein